MAASRAKRSRELVQEVLESLPHHTEDVTLHVFQAIETHEPWCGEYKDLRNEYEGRKQSGQHSLNQRIGGLIREITGREVLSARNPAPQTNLIKTYSKLG